MITIGSISREKASEDFPFLTQHYRGRRKAIKAFTHLAPDYGGFLRGRVASNFGPQIIVVYRREEALASDPIKIRQFLKGVAQLPIPLQQNTLVVSDNADIYGTLADIRQRANDVG
ncbi:hypothetical protein ONV78_03405 [Hahella sp. CR1]|uniref:hypothetical protein n=1 Tax=Hahella sp. CR1 TaxID=2992807 RepID=UPI00244111D3|nr:hypothetical protein [Hahella sp. CR1]MDG9666770.1 hypothetical protein [Hahella sp. CR1]